MIARAGCCLLFTIVSLALPRPGMAAVTAVTECNKVQLATWDDTNRKSFAASADHLLRRGLIADRKQRSVTIVAESCGLAAGATVEFCIVGETSDRAYEALFMTFAKAKDIGDALEFIGLPRGANVSARQQRLWPSGERVMIDVAEFKPGAGTPRPLEEFVLDAKVDGTLLRSGFAYCGSPRLLDKASGHEAALADIEAPVSILSLYNEPQTVLDVPRIAPQGEVYERYTANPARLLDSGHLVRLVFTPEHRSDNKPRRLPLKLTVAPTADGGIGFEVEPEGEKAATVTDFTTLLTLFKGMAGQQRDPMVTLRLDDALTLRQAHELATVLEQIEGENGIRLEPPPEGQLYYRAFLPDEKWRKRKGRLSQPWELHVGLPAQPDGIPPLKLIKTHEDWSDPDSLEPLLTTKTFEAAAYSELPSIMESAGHGLPVLLVYAPFEAPLGLFMQGVRLVQKEHATIYLFGEE